jgi:hypothetical protein
MRPLTSRFAAPLPEPTQPASSRLSGNKLAIDRFSSRSRVQRGDLFIQFQPRFAVELLDSALHGDAEAVPDSLGIGALQSQYSVYAEGLF